MRTGDLMEHLLCQDGLLKPYQWVGEITAAAMAGRRTRTARVFDVGALHCGSTVTKKCAVVLLYMNI